MKKAIKINVETKKLEYVELKDDYNDIYNNIGNGCTCFEVPVGFENKDWIYCDEEICFRENDIKGGFMMKNWNYPILNNGIILGTDDDYESVDCKTKIEDLEIIFIGMETAKKWAKIVLSSPATFAK
jgi:hypothetical protein